MDSLKGYLCGEGFTSSPAPFHMQRCPTNPSPLCSKWSGTRTAGSQWMMMSAYHLPCANTVRGLRCNNEQDSSPVLVWRLTFKEDISRVKSSFSTVSSEGEAVKYGTYPGLEEQERERRQENLTRRVSDVVKAEEKLPKAKPGEGKRQAGLLKGQKYMKTWRSNKIIIVAQTRTMV